MSNNNVTESKNNLGSYQFSDWRSDFEPTDYISYDVIKAEPLVNEGRTTTVKGIKVRGSGHPKNSAAGTNENPLVDYSKIRAKAPITNDGKKKVNPLKNEVISASNEIEGNFVDEGLLAGLKTLSGVVGGKTLKGWLVRGAASGATQGLVTTMVAPEIAKLQLASSALNYAASQGNKARSKTEDEDERLDNERKKRKVFRPYVRYESVEGKKSFSNFYEQATSALQQPSIGQRIRSGITNYVKGEVDNIKKIPGNVKQGIKTYGKNLKRQPVKTILQTAWKPTKWLAKTGVKDVIVNKTADTIMKKTGTTNNPVAKFAKGAAEWTLPYMKWGAASKLKAAGSVLAKPLAVASALTLLDQRPAGPKDERAMMRDSMNPKSPLYRKRSEVKK